MKHLFKKSAIITTILLVVFTACEPEPPKPVDTSGDPDYEARIDFEALLYAFNPLYAFNGTNATTLQADGVSSNPGMEKLEIIQTHVEVTKGINSYDSPNIELRQGEFFLTGDDDNTIYGTYYGYGERYSQYLKAELFLTIEGGTGLYNGARGSFKQKVRVHDHSEQAFIIELNGQVFIYEQI